VGRLDEPGRLREAAGMSQAVIHLVGIIIEQPLKGQTFQGVHVRGTQAVVEAARQAGVSRLVHMSALGTREGAASEYHRTKWLAEESVRSSGLNWTIIRPSLIHGPDGDFMRLMKRFICGLTPPVIPYFGSGRAAVQPVSVTDVAHCCVESLFREGAVGQVIPLGGPRRYSWVQFYNACRALMPGARRWKPLVSLPVTAANLAARVTGPPMALAAMALPGLDLLRFDRGQIQMSQEDIVCDHTIAERMFDMRMRSFEDELAIYAGLIA
jgi:NADH dehydrogenase